MSMSNWDEMVAAAPGVARAGRSGDDLDDYVLAFEEAYRDQGRADPASFLPPRGHPLRAAVLRELVRVDLEFGWERGCPRGLDEYCDAFPSLAEDAEGLREIAFEEYRLRRQAGESATPGEYRERYGVDLDPLVGRSRVVMVPTSSGPSAGDPVDLPGVGDVFLGFRLDAELGRGSFGRVFLAREGDLSDRRVVVKVTAAPRDEARTLAQLQHENIVPVYSRHRRGGLQAVCMPYLGGVTLRDVLDDLKAKGGLPGSGKGLLSSLDKSVEARAGGARVDPPGAVRGPLTSPPWPRPADAFSADPSSAGGGPAAATSASAATVPRAPAPGPQQVPAEARQRLARLTYVEAVLWMISGLANGLAHAHGRGILHLDLKPANVLLTEDGRPLLLDFNLSVDLKQGPAGASGVGGTLPYMAPEHLRAYLGRAAAGALLDVRTDLFSLGVIAFEMLTGRPPFPVRDGNRLDVAQAAMADRQLSPPALRPWNPSVSPAVEAVVRRCLEPDPARRYASAGELAEDLERHLAHLPLRHTPEPSPVERIGKYLRRNARGVSVTATLLVGLGFLTGLTALASSKNASDGRLSAVRALSAFHERSLSAQTRRSHWANRPEEILPTLALTREALRTFGALSDRPESPWWGAPPALYLDPDDLGPLRRETGELLLLVAEAEKALAVGDDRLRGLSAAGDANERAARSFPGGEAPRLLWAQRARISRALGALDEAAAAEGRARSTPLLSSGDFTLEGRDLVARGRLREALELFDEAKDLDPRGLGAWLGKGYCHDRLAQDQEALTAYTTCIALDPKHVPGWFNRGGVQLRLRRYDRAIRDFEKALSLKPGDPDVLIPLGVALLESGRPGDAEKAFSGALKSGPVTPRVYLMRARARRLTGDAPGAEDDLREGLRREPDDELAWAARARARANDRDDLQGALADLDESLRRYPDSFVSLQNKAALLAERLGKTREAIAVLDTMVGYYPGFAPARGSRGVLHARLGDRDAALGDVQAAVTLAPSPQILYYAACARALTSRQRPEDAHEALRMLDAALASGFGREYVDDDHDLDPIRGHADFARTVREGKTTPLRTSTHSRTPAQPAITGNNSG